MEKKAFSSSRLRVCSFLMYYVTTSITSLRMILDVYCAFFLPDSRCSRSVSSRHHLQNCPEVSPVGRCTCAIIPVVSKWQVLFSTKYNSFYNALPDVNVFVVHLLVGLAYHVAVGQGAF